MERPSWNAARVSSRLRAVSDADPVTVPANEADMAPPRFGFDVRLLAGGAVVVALLVVVANLIGSAAWLWTGLAGTGFLVAYARLGTRAFLIVGALLVGSGVGILFEATLGWEGAYLMSVGTGLVTAEGIDTRPGRYALLIGALLAALGLVLAVAAAGPASLVGLCLIAAAAGAVAATRR